MYNGVAIDCNILQFTAKSSLYGVLCANVHIGMSVCVCVCVCACREGGFELRSVKAFGSPYPLRPAGRAESRRPDGSHLNDEKRE